MVLRSKDKGECPLLGVTVDVHIVDTITEVTLCQRYKNTHNHPIEAVYTFPIDESAAVCSFQVEVGGALLTGQIEEKDKALEAYDDAISGGKGAYLLEEEKDDIFTASLGNLPPEEEILIRIRYMSRIDINGEGSARFILPTTIAPRYIPESTPAWVANRINPPVGSVSYGLTLNAHIACATPIASISSPSHPISLNLHCTDGAHQATVSLALKEATLDADFVLEIMQKDVHKEQIWMETMKTVDESGTSTSLHAAMVEFRPGPMLKSSSCAVEAIFLLDRSASMGGTKIAKARAALQLFLRSLPVNSLFNIVGFGTMHRTLFPRSVVYNEQNFRVATQHVREVHADLGGTNILTPLEEVLQAPNDPSFTRQVFVLTDGEVENTREVICVCHKYASRARIFTFGIGNAVSHHLIRGMARAGRGKAEFATCSGNEALEPKVIRALKYALQPSFKNIRIDWGSLSVRAQAPHHVPSVFGNEAVVVWALLEELPDLSVPTTVALHGSSETEDIDLSITLQASQIRTGWVINTMAARSAIRDLEEGSSRFHDESTGATGRFTHNDIKQEIIQLGRTYSLVSSETSFVVVEERVDPCLDASSLCRVAILPPGWKTPPPPPPVRHYGVMVGMGCSVVHRKCFGGGLNLCAPKDEDDEEDEEGRQASTPQRLILLQQFNGAWELTSELKTLLGVSSNACSDALKMISLSDPSHASILLGTALALAYLQVHHPSRREDWELILTKGHTWLSQQNGSDIAQIQAARLVHT